MNHLKAKILTGALLTGIAFASSALADTEHRRPAYDQEDSSLPGYTTPDATYDQPYVAPGQRQMNSAEKPKQEEQQSISQNNPTPENKTLRDEVLGITPELGMLSYTNPNGAYTARALVGVGASFNVTPLVMGSDLRDWYVGVSTGALYSHNGSSSSNFFGSNSNVVSTDNSNLLIIPTDLKIGYNIGNDVRVSAHGGGNIIYRSAPASLFLGDDSNTSDSNWKIYPNVGLDGEWQVSKTVSILLRPDVTITPGVDVFSATIGANIIAL